MAEASSTSFVVTVTGEADHEGSAFCCKRYDYGSSAEKATAASRMLMETPCL